jgi:hypothetical protein
MAEAGEANTGVRFRISDNAKWIVVTLVIPLTTWLVGQWQERVAKIQANAATQIEEARRVQEAQIADARGDVAAMTALLPALADPDPRRSGLATDILKRLQKAQHGDSELDEAVAAIEARIKERRNSNDPAERELGARQAEAIVQASGTKQLAELPAAAAPVANARLATVTASKPNIVYLQVYSNAQLPAARIAQARLRQAGVAVPGIENVERLIRGRRVVQRGQVRFFNDADIGQARWTADLMNKLGGGPWSVVRTRIRQKVPLGQVEIWWPTS